MIIEKSDDIRLEKKVLRTNYKAIRKKMSDYKRKTCDASILQNILKLHEYQKCSTLLCFVSTPIEVDTRGIINRALRDGKNVAVPYCITETREMNFYCIRSLDELVPRTFGVLEPIPVQSNLVANFSNTLCILPGLAFDCAGYRLGYGGGYYDRFLSSLYYPQGGITIGISYCRCIAKRLPRGRYDIPCDILVSEKLSKTFTRHSNYKTHLPHRH